MADLLLTVPSGEVSLTGSVAKTVLAATAPANQRLKIMGVEIFGKGTSNTDTPIKCELSRITTNGGTATTITPAKVDDDDGETAQGTYQANFTVEPTTYGANMRIWEVHPQTGIIVYFPMHQEIKIKGGNIVGLRMTSTQAETVSAQFLVEE